MKPRIIAVVPTLESGGAERWQVSLINHAERVDWRSIVIVRNGGVLLNEINVPYFLCPAETNDGIVHTTRDASKLGADMIVTWGMGGLHGLREIGLPILHISHSSRERSIGSAYDEYIAKIGDTPAKYLAAVSQAACAMFDRPARVIHNGSPVDRVTPCRGREWQRAKWGVKEGDVVALFVGRLSGEKRPELLLRAIASLPHKWKLVIQGTGSMIWQLRQEAEDIAPGRVIFPDERYTGLGDVYAASDVLGMPSLIEAFPLVAIEAWQAGLPVVANRFNLFAELEATYGHEFAHVPEDETVEAWRVALNDAVFMADSEKLDAIQMCAVAQFSATAMVGRFEDYVFECMLRDLEETRDD